MPLYEWECLACDLRFEELASVSQGRLERACPGCGRMSPRVISTFAIASGASPQPQTSAAPARSARPAEAPICLRYPHIPLLCHMDKPTAERAVAYAQGRGAEYDDRKGQAEETRRKRGLPPPAPPAPPLHAHFHKRHQPAAAPEHGHSASGHDHTHDHGGKRAPAATQKGKQPPPAPAHRH
jgi:putative FmdB family regulatory protein